MREAMLYANHKGVTLDVALTMMSAELGTSGGMGGQRIRTTPKQDLQAVFRQVSGNVLGRRLSDAEVEKFVKAYNRQEVSAAYVGLRHHLPRLQLWNRSSLLSLKKQGLWVF
jgi:hypothetical protein